MKRVFRNERKVGEVYDVIKYTQKILSEFPDATIHVGTDSQNHRRKTTYAICVCYRYGLRGVHVIYNRTHIKPKIKDRWTRLWKEAEMSIEVAEYIQNNSSFKVHTIDMDYNNDKHHFSSKLVQAAKGWAQSLGYKVSVKPEEQVATRAADHLCQ
jgi:predicted RNase H-related nuclease YkuK (DUF458 family)